MRREGRNFIGSRTVLGAILVLGLSAPAYSRPDPARVKRTAAVITWNASDGTVSADPVRLEVFSGPGDGGSAQIEAVTLNLAEGSGDCESSAPASVADQTAGRLGKNNAMAVYSPCEEKGESPDSVGWLKRAAEKHPGKPVMMRLESTGELMRLVRALRKDSKSAEALSRIAVSLDRQLTTAEYRELERLTKAHPNLRAHLIARGNGTKTRSWFRGMTYSESRAQGEASWNRLLEPDMIGIQARLNKDRVARKRSRIEEDGVPGGKTRSAITAFQRDHGIEPTGELDAETVAKLFGERALTRGIDARPPSADQAAELPPLPKPRPRDGDARTVPLPAARPPARLTRPPTAPPQPPITSGETAKYKAHRAKGSAYFKYGQNTAAKRRMEGGQKDRFGRPLQTLQCYLRGECAYVSVAMDKRLKLPSSTKLRIPELEKKYGRKIEFRVVDTGGAFTGKGYGRVDICVDTEKQSYASALNGSMTLLFER
ncbi:MAG: hypothetical protein AUJ52_09085 [Elusimicrobia bacterium CG1_02_63_36]|nr:MAG: hypothetical protein AUJ52_09085 [Elusimicrobia bacterium CG1_02_63_36]